MGTTRDGGVGVRSGCLMFFTGGSVISFAGVSGAAAALTISARGLFALNFAAFSDTPRLSIQGGTYFADGLAISAAGLASFPAQIGNTAATIGRTRVVRSGSPVGYGVSGACINGHVSLIGCEFQDCTTGPCILINSFSEPNAVNLSGCVSAAAGNNTQYGCTVGSTSQMGSRIAVAVASVTVTGTLGDLRFANDSVITPWSTFSRTNVPDRFGNNVFGTLVGDVVSGPPILVNNQSGGALAVGDVVRSNGTTGQYTSAQADTLANAAPAAIMITAPASATAGYAVGPGQGTPSLTCTATPTIGAILYLSVGTARQGTTTKPVISGTQQIVKLGRVLSTAAAIARIVFEPDLIPENVTAAASLWLEVADAAGTFSATATAIAYTGAITANRAATLEALSTLSVGTRRTIADLTTGGAFNINLTPNAADSIDGGVAGAAVAIPAGSKQTLVVEKTPTAGWKIL